MKNNMDNVFKILYGIDIVLDVIAIIVCFNTDNVVLRLVSLLIVIVAIVLLNVTDKIKDYIETLNLYIAWRNEREIRELQHLRNALRRYWDDWVANKDK